MIEILKKGGVGVMPTDTIYGIIGSALFRKTVERIYKLRERNLKKPMIILIGSFNHLNLFNIKINDKIKKILSRKWPGKVSIILPCKNKKFLYLHRGTETLAFRLPKKQSLIRLLNKTGPLVAPSVNREGLPPAKNIKEARKYFGNKIDFYKNGGIISAKPSTLIKIENGKIKIIRL